MKFKFERAPKEDASDWYEKGNITTKETFRWYKCITPTLLLELRVMLTRRKPHGTK